MASSPTKKFVTPIIMAAFLCIAMLIVANALTNNSIWESIWNNAVEIEEETEPANTYSAYGVQFKTDGGYTVVEEIDTDTESYTLWVDDDGNYVCIIDYYQVEAVEDQENVSDYTGEFETTEYALCLSNNLYTIGFYPENHGYKGLSGLLFSEADDADTEDESNIAKTICSYEGSVMYYITEDGQTIFSTGDEEHNIKIFQYVSSTTYEEE